MTDLETWYLDIGCDLFFDVYKKKDLEKEVAYPVLQEAKIEQLIELPSGDILIEFLILNEDRPDERHTEYYQLSEIHLFAKNYIKEE